MVKVENISKYYNDIAVVNNISFNLREGSVIGFLGPNGAGKTTLFQVLTGLFVPDSGVIEINGYDIRENAVPALGSLGIVFAYFTSSSLSVSPASTRLQFSRLCCQTNSS